MPYNNPLYHPGTNTLVTHSFAERVMTAEFDDALCDQAWWKNARYNGSKITGKKINAFTPSEGIGIDEAQIGLDFVIGNYIKDGWTGDKTYNQEPVINDFSTALYLSSTVIGGTEDNQFATLKNHSYIGIDRILLINPVDDTVFIIDKTAEPFDEFHRFLTNDFPTGVKCSVKLLDESLSHNLKDTYRVKMNKGYLLKALSFTYAGELSGSAGNNYKGPLTLTENNSMYLYKSGSFKDFLTVTGSVVSPEPTGSEQPNQLRFRYGVVEMFASGTGSDASVAGHDYGHKFSLRRVGPLFLSSSILQNKFTQQYYTGSYGLIKHNTSESVDNTFGETYSKMFAASSLGSASRFLGIDTLNFLADNNSNKILTEQEKTELHITFFEGTKDFAPGFHDERSIGTFEVDASKAQLGIIKGGECNGNGLPTKHELTFKGPNDQRFLPTLNTFSDAIQNAHLESTASSGINGCVPTGSIVPTGFQIQAGTTSDKTDNIQCYVQGGALGVVGYQGAASAALYLDPSFGGPVIANTNWAISNAVSMSSDNYYSGSFRYEASFLDKDHTLILDLNKDAELFDGHGGNGILLIPENIHPIINNNLNYYLSLVNIGPIASSDNQQNIT